MIGGIISTVGGVVTKIGEVGTTIGKIIGSFGLDGYDIGRPVSMIGMPNPFAMGGYDIKMDETQQHPITKEERDSVQALANFSGMVSKEQALTYAADYLSTNYVATHGAFYNIPATHEILTMTTKYCYDPNKTTTSRNKKQGTSDIVTIGKDDHAYIQLIPRNFKNYDRIRNNHKFCYLKKVLVKVDQKSSSSSSQQFAFYAVPQDTRKWSNDQVFSSYIKATKEINSNLQYVLNFFSPSILRLIGDDWQSVGSTANPSFDPRIHSNSIISLDILDQIKGTGNDTKDFFSYGTCCFTGGSGNEKTYFDVKVDMIFECINDQAILRPLPAGEEDWEGSQDGDGDVDSDGEGDGDGSGDGSGEGDGSGSGNPIGNTAEAPAEVPKAPAKVPKNPRRKRTNKTN